MFLDFLELLEELGNGLKPGGMVRVGPVAEKLKGGVVGQICEIGDWARRGLLVVKASG